MTTPSPRTDPKRNQRNIAIAIALLSFVVIVFLVTVVRLGADVLNRPL